MISQGNKMPAEQEIVSHEVAAEEQSNSMEIKVDIECGEVEKKGSAEGEKRSAFASRSILASLVAFSGVLALSCVAALRSSSSPMSFVPRSAHNSRKLGERVKIGAHVPNEQGGLSGYPVQGFDSALIYQDLASAQNPSFVQYVLAPEFSAGRDVVLDIYTSDTDFSQNLDWINNSGEVSSWLWNLGSNLKNADFHGKTLYVRPFHEWNGDWFPWGIYAAGNDINKFKQVYEKVVTTIKQASDNRADIKFQLSGNCDPPGGRDSNGTDFVDAFPSDHPELVDMVCCSAYNRDGLTPWHTRWESFASVFSKGYERMSKIADKPLCVGETASVSDRDGGHRSQWINDILPALSQFPRVAQLDFFLENKDGDWALTTDDEFRALQNVVSNAP